MSEHDLLLGDTAATIVAKKHDVLLELVADGVMWRRAPVAASAWARGMPWRPEGHPPLRDRLAMSGYLHLDRACYRLGEHWLSAGNVRLRLESVSAWWLCSLTKTLESSPTAGPGNAAHMTRAHRCSTPPDS